ncbi:sensor histidine kinase [Actinopolymorpha sp. NPDC004070]|uniref:sensor histidine kinase n=1 Tax=Actinopolymorpha sp. NPDC004070 TaxID=3154548 RepID=UPI0033B84831
MSGGVVDSYAGHMHETGFYASDEDFRALIVPFVEEGLAAGEPVVIGYDERKTDLLRSWLDDPYAVTFQTGGSMYATPARAIGAWQRTFERHVAAGASRVRIAGDVPHAGNGGCFEGWDRYESALNTVWGKFPVDSLCLYDATTVPAPVRDVVERTHPRILTTDGVHTTNSRYDRRVTNARIPVAADPLEASVPNVELVNPSAAEARHALEQLGRDLVRDSKLDDLLFGISEAVTNARLHGVPPTTVRIWSTDDRLVADVQDKGRGPTDPLAGLVPMSSTTFGTGLGLWVTHLLDIDAALISTADGFSFRLRAGRDPALVHQ